MESIRDKLSQGMEQEANVGQKPSVPLPQERENAKQDLFNTHEQAPPQSLQPPLYPQQQQHQQHQQQLQQQHQRASQPHPGLQSFPIGQSSSNFPFPAAPQSVYECERASIEQNCKNSTTASDVRMNNYTAYTQHKGNQVVSPLVSYTDSKAPAQTQPGAQQLMEQHIRQHIQNAQLQVQQQHELRLQASQQQQISQQPQQNYAQCHQQQPSKPDASMTVVPVDITPAISLPVNPSTVNSLQPTTNTAANAASTVASTTASSVTVSSTQNGVGTTHNGVGTTHNGAGTTQNGVGKSNDKPVVTVTDVNDVDENLNPPKPRPPSPEYDDLDGKEVHEENAHLFRVCICSMNISSHVIFH